MSVHCVRNGISQHLGQRVVPGVPGRRWCRAILRCSRYRLTRKYRRPGMTLLLVIVCLIFLTAVMGSMLRQFHLSHRQQRLLERKQQATFLAESAMERASWALRHDENYPGELWQISAADLGTNHDGQTTITIERSETDTWVIGVEAIYPVNTALQARVRKSRIHAIPDSHAATRGD